MDKDRIKGKADDVVGRVKREVGEWTGDTETEAEGTAQQVKGKVENAWGKAKDAVATVKAGIAKGVDDKNNAQIRLGMALISSGQKADAQKALDAVKGPDTDKSVMVAHLWSLYARH